MNARSKSARISGLPLGWNYNPAAWSQRVPLTALALAGLALSAWFAFYSPVALSPAPSFLSFSPRFQLVSANLRRFAPSPELGISALGFLIQALGTLVGGNRRWRTHPRWVVSLGIALVLLAAFNVSQTALELVMTDAWCVPPLCAALVSILMVGPAMDEILASLQHLKRARHACTHKWLFFWDRHSLAHLEN